MKQLTLPNQLLAGLIWDMKVFHVFHTGPVYTQEPSVSALFYTGTHPEVTQCTLGIRVISDLKHWWMSIANRGWGNKMKSGVYYSTYPVLACSRHLEQRVITMFTHDAVSQVRSVAMVILKLWERGFPCVLCFVYPTQALCESVCWSWTVETRSCKDVKSRVHLQDTEVEAVCVPVPALCEHSQTLIWILNHLVLANNKDRSLSWSWFFLFFLIHH